MGAKIFAVVALAVILVFVGVNTYIVNARIGNIIDEVEASGSYEDAARVREKFMRCERYISITVSHDDLTNIEDLFSEYEAELREDSDDAEITKSRLINALSHLRRLSGINIDSVV